MRNHNLQGSNSFAPRAGAWDHANLTIRRLGRSDLAPPLQARTSLNLLLGLELTEEKGARRTLHPGPLPYPAPPTLLRICTLQSTPKS